MFFCENKLTVQWLSVGRDEACQKIRGELFIRKDKLAFLKVRKFNVELDLLNFLLLAFWPLDGLKQGKMQAPKS